MKVRLFCDIVFFEVGNYSIMIILQKSLIFHNSEVYVKQSIFLTMLNTTSQQPPSPQNLHDDILSKQPAFKQLTETASTLMALVGDDEASALADRLQAATDR